METGVEKFRRTAESNISVPPNHIWVPWFAGRKLRGWVFDLKPKNKLDLYSHSFQQNNIDIFFLLKLNFSLKK